jgi:hypothetical protein
MTIERHGDIEIDQDLSFQRVDWRVQRVGWALMMLMIIAASVGAFGHGLVASADTRTGDGRLEVKYDRIARHASPGPLSLRLLPGPLRDTIVDIWISREFLAGVRIERIEPEPDQEEAGEDGTRFRFRIADPARPAHITFQVEPDAIGGRSGMIGLVNGDSVRFRQYVLP